VDRGRRSAIRRAVRIPVLFQWAGKLHWSVTEDISAGGVFLRAYHPPEPGERLELRFRSADETEDLVIPAVVVHSWEKNRASLLEEAAPRLAGAGVSFAEGVGTFIARLGSFLPERCATRLGNAFSLSGCEEGPERREAGDGISADVYRLEDPARIEDIFEELASRIQQVHLKQPDSGMGYASYLRRVLRTTTPPRVEVEPVVMNSGDFPLDAMIPLSLSFSLAGRCYHCRLFENPGTLEKVWTFPLPSVLIHGPERRHHRYAFEMKNPLTVEFTDPSNPGRQRIKNVLDISYRGVAFKNYPGEEVYIPGTRIPDMLIYAFDHFCRRTDARIKHASLVCASDGEIFQSVGLEFLGLGDEDLAEIPRIKEGELEEITGGGAVFQHLSRLAREGAKLLAESANCILLTDGRVELGRGDSTRALVLRGSAPPRKTDSPFVEGEVNYHYLSCGIYHFFKARSWAENGFLRIEAPTAIYKAKRRHALRVNSDEVRDCFQFVHPILGKRLSLPVRDVSVRGLSFEGDCSEHLLWKGFCLRGCEVTLEGDSLPLGSVEVRSLSRTVSEDGKVVSRCGVQFMDLPVPTEKRISSFIFERSNPKIHSLRAEKIENLWQLFYQSGFIYPSKDAYIRKIKPEINKTWEKLLSEETSFYRNIVFRELGKELGTASAVQVYENTWMFQHLAAAEHPLKLIPKYVLLGLAHFLMENHEIKFLITYFRKENSFPRKVYSGFLESYPQEEQLRFTTFSYLTLDLEEGARETRVGLGPRTAAPGVRIEAANDKDKEILENHFRKTLHPLLIRSRSLYRDAFHLPETSALFLAKGLIRERQCLVARDTGNGVLAFALLENSSPGINLSGLLNGFSVYSVRGEGERSRQVRKSLILAALNRYREWGARTAIALTCEEDITDYLEAGFVKVKEYICFTSSRRAIKSYYEYVQERFGRFEQRKQKIRRGGQAPEPPSV
jgi:hypothetical protein